MCRRKVDVGETETDTFFWNGEEREREEGRAWEEEGSIVKKGDGRVVDGLFDKYTGIPFAVVVGGERFTIGNH